MITVVRSVAAFFFIGAVLAIALRQFDRVVRHRLFGRESPALLVRDLVFFWTLAVLLTAPAVAGALGVTLADKLPWVLFSTTLGVVAVIVWAYYEFIVIGRER